MYGATPLHGVLFSLFVGEMKYLDGFLFCHVWNKGHKSSARTTIEAPLFFYLSSMEELGYK
jgi:hypothetical protein